ncbi:MAG: DUF302 domain-containing protein [Gammaproteobacteria bacterium]|nr:DUF302 domain-containing protein [Gammaproteobacteria bacterium]
MSQIKNLLALFGLVAIIGSITLYIKYDEWITGYSQLRPESREIYADMAKALFKTGSAVDATVWRAKVMDGLDAEDVEDVIRSVAIENNIKNVGELPLSKQVEAMTGQPQRLIKIYMFCSPLTAAKMIAYNDAYSAFLPCRVSLVEDKEGNLWLYTMSLDMMIDGGDKLPPELEAEAIRVKEVMLDIMNRGATGEF